MGYLSKPVQKKREEYQIFVDEGYEYVSNEDTKPLTSGDRGSLRLKKERRFTPRPLPFSGMLDPEEESLVSRRGGKETNETTLSNIQRAYFQVRKDNEMLKQNMEAMSDEDFYSQTGDELGQIKSQKRGEKNFVTFDKVVPKFSKKQNELQKYIFEKAKDRGYEGPELAQFMAQVAIETDYFKTLEEYGGGKDKYGGGKRYKGRGFLQLTHDYNYEAAGKALGYKGLADDPDLVLDRETAADTSFWFWETNVRPAVQDFSNTDKVTRIVNGAGMLKKNERNDAFNFMRLSGNTLYEE